MTTTTPGTFPGGGVCALDEPDVWDVVVIAGKQWPKTPPGYVVVSGAGVPRKLDIREGNGMTGAVVIYKGEKLSEFTLTLYLVDTSDWADYFEWRAVLAKPPVGATAKALPIYHPALAYIGISSVLVQDESQPEPDGDTGLYKVVVKLVQWKKPTPALGAPTGSADDNGPTPQSATEQHIADLAAQVKGLAN